MEKALKDFLVNTSGEFKSGYVKFENNYYAFLKRGEDFYLKEVDYEMFELNFEIFTEERLKLFTKTLEGFIHNSNGKVSPLLSRLGLLEPKIEAAKELPDFRGIDRVYQKAVKSTKELMEIYEFISNYLYFYPFETRESVNLKKFFEGYHLAVITDREIKHKVVFTVDIDDFINASVICRDFVLAVYCLGESFFNLIRGKEELVDLKITATKNGRVEVFFFIEKKPFEIEESGDLGWKELQSLMFYKLFKKTADRNGWQVTEVKDGIKLEV